MNAPSTSKMLTQASIVHIDVASDIYHYKKKGFGSIHEVTTLMEETIMIRTK